MDNPAPPWTDHAFAAVHIEASTGMYEVYVRVTPGGPHLFAALFRTPETVTGLGEGQMDNHNRALARGLDLVVTDMLRRFPRYPPQGSSEP